QRLAVHWGMVMAAYPFFGRVAETTGRLLRLQSTVAAAQVQRRIREELGERETVARAARRILRSFHDWGVLEETGRRGVYQPAPSLPLSDPRLASWLLEATLVASRSTTMSFKALLQNPSLFPFALQPLSAVALTAGGRVSLSRLGLDQEL